jgi:UDP-N-acetylglucosamine 1-carboxyvinyltransferase
MPKFIINGGKPLCGIIEVKGAKNAATKILAACLLTDEECQIENLPQIEDVFRMMEIMESMGAKIKREKDGKVIVRAKELYPRKMNFDLVCKMRSSILLMGALIARCEEFKIPSPGGCIIGARSIDAHLNVLTLLGVKIKQKEDFYHLERNHLRGCEIVMSEISVTATENAIFGAVLAEGRTKIKCAAMEPHVQDLCYFLNKMGAKISGIGTHCLIVDGVNKLNGAKHYIIPDTIEMCTFISLAAATRSEIKIENVVPEFIEVELLKFKEANVNFKINKLKEFAPGWGYKMADLDVFSSAQLKAVKKIHNMPYPGFAADSLSPFAVLMTQADGISLIHDWMYEGRLKYIEELNKMGANAVICDPHRALITGSTPLYGKKITSFDLRAGAALIIAALVAAGETEVDNVYQVDRGYEKIEERLKRIGAEIKRINN